MAVQEFQWVKSCFMAVVMLAMSTVYAHTVGAVQDQSGMGVLLVKDGKPVASIVIGKEASRSAQFAAAELQYHLEKITGARLPVLHYSPSIKGTCILVGESEATKALGLHNSDFKHQEYLIKFFPDNLILLGKDKEDFGKMDYNQPGTFPNQFDEQGTCYAVYDFLERYCGVRWYLPTELGLVFPKRKTLVVKGRELRRAPVMKYRELYSLRLMPASLTDIPGPALPVRDALLFAHRQRLTGVQPYACGHSFEGYYSQHLKDHPEWFAKGYDKNIPQGLRDKPVNMSNYSPYYPNMCYTNAGFVQHVVNRARSYFDTGQTEESEQAAGDFFSLGPMDSSDQDKMCKCPECEKFLHKKPPCEKWRKQHFFWDDKNSDYIFGFVNKVAREVAKTHPDKYLTMFAYHQTYYPPTREPLEPNVAISFCIHALLRAVPAMDRAVNDLLNKWDEESKVRPKYLWLYFHRPGPANPFFPGFMPHNMVKQMKDYHRRGFRGIFIEPPYFPSQLVGEGNPIWAPIVNQLELYIAFKLADDPNLDGDQMINEFFTLYYGAAARPMQALYGKIEQVYCDPANYTFNPDHYFGYQTKDIAWGKLGTAERMADFGKLMEAAKKAAKTDTEKKRVEIFEKSVWNPMQTAHTEYQQNLSSVEFQFKKYLSFLFNWFRAICVDMKMSIMA